MNTYTTSVPDSYQRQLQEESARELKRMLKYVDGSAGTDMLIDKLVAEFGSPAAVIDESTEHIIDIIGEENRRIAEFLKTVPEISRTYYGEKVSGRFAFDTPMQLVDYLKYWFLSEQREVYIVALMNAAGNIVGMCDVTDGSVDHVRVNVSALIAAFSKAGAASYILAHNHPNGALTPSDSDITTTQNIASVSAEVDVRLHDHYIFAKGAHISVVDFMNRHGRYIY